MKNPWLMSLLLCSVALVAYGQGKKEEVKGLTIDLSANLDDPKTVVEIENLRGRFEKFAPGVDDVKIEKALKDDLHYISDFQIKDEKIVAIRFKRKKDEKPKKS